MVIKTKEQLKISTDIKPSLGQSRMSTEWKSLCRQQLSFIAPNQIWRLELFLSEIESSVSTFLFCL